MSATRTATYWVDLPARGTTTRRRFVRLASSAFTTGPAERLRRHVLRVGRLERQREDRTGEHSLWAEALRVIAGRGEGLARLPYGRDADSSATGVVEISPEHAAVALGEP